VDDTTNQLYRFVAFIIQRADQCRIAFSNRNVLATSARRVMMVHP
jgi:hypothetical protein